VEISPEPTVAEREAIVAAVALDERRRGSGTRPGWLEVALREGVQTDGDHDSEPSL
jgi:hypothetical protein